MGLSILLRQRHNTNHFRDFLIGALSTGVGDGAILCSGFFQENFKSSIYRVSQEGNLINALVSNRIALTTVGVHNHAWLQAYKNFRDNLQNAGVNISAKISQRYHWHAKIFLLLKKDVPVFGIVGSSNMTRNAFGLTAPFNYEADVILWVDQFKQFARLQATTLERLQDARNEILVANYSAKRNGGLTIQQRLNQINTDIARFELRDLE